MYQVHLPVDPSRLGVLSLEVPISLSWSGDRSHHVSLELCGCIPQSFKDPIHRYHLDPHDNGLVSLMPKFARATKIPHSIHRLQIRDPVDRGGDAYKILMTSLDIAAYKTLNVKQNPSFKDRGNTEDALLR